MVLLKRKSCNVNIGRFAPSRTRRGRPPSLYLITGFRRGSVLSLLDLTNDHGGRSAIPEYLDPAKPYFTCGQQARPGVTRPLKMETRHNHIEVPSKTPGRRETVTPVTFHEAHPSSAA